MTLLFREKSFQNLFFLKLFVCFLDQFKRLLDGFTIVLVASTENIWVLVLQI